MINAATVGQLLGLSARAVYELHSRGLLPGYRFGRALRFDPADEFVEATAEAAVDDYTLTAAPPATPAAGGPF